MVPLAQTSDLNFGQFLVRLIYETANLIWNVFVDFFNMLAAWAISFLDYLLSFIGFSLPELDLTIVSTYWAMADLWLPLTEYAALQATYYTVRGSLNATKWLLKIIPTVWG